MSSSSNRPPPIPAPVPRGADDEVSKKKKMKKRKGTVDGRNDDINDDMIFLDDSEEDHDGKRRFEWELEFVQCLASPAYLHFLATYRDDDDDNDDNDDNDDESEESGGDDDDEVMEDSNDEDKVPRHKNKKKSADAAVSSSGLLQDLHFQAYLRYLRDTWSRPEYAIYLSYPHCLYFLNLLIEHPIVMAREWAQPPYRNFCHQQQFLAWQHRHSSLYGHGLGSTGGDTSTGDGSAATAPSEAT